MQKINSWYLPQHEKHLVKYIKKADGYQQDCRDHALSFVKEFDCAIDIGAHIGLWSRELSQQFNQVLAFEPIKEHRDCFIKNVLIDNKKGNVQLLGIALGEYSGMVSAIIDPESTGHTTIIENDHAGSPAIIQETLDNLFINFPEHLRSLKKLDNDLDNNQYHIIDDRILNQNKIDFIKIDCEGGEYFILKGAREVLLKYKPIINIEQKRFLLESNDPFYLKHGQYAACRYLESIGAKFISRFKDEFVYGWN